jgi:hypothetical protein
MKYCANYANFYDLWKNEMQMRMTSFMTLPVHWQIIFLSFFSVPNKDPSKIFAPLDSALKIASDSADWSNHPSPFESAFAFRFSKKHKNLRDSHNIARAYFEGFKQRTRKHKNQRNSSMTDKVEIIAHDTTVCVTGGTGFIAAHIIAMLLKDGFKVNATVRSVKEESKLKFLKDLDKDSRLKFCCGLDN